VPYVDASVAIFDRSTALTDDAYHDLRGGVLRVAAIVLTAIVALVDRRDRWAILSYEMPV
jgi:hypothetical protein